MTRFEMELNGLCGEYWEKKAHEELNEVKINLLAGTITIDENGVARNCIGRVLMSDLVEKVAMVTDKIDVEATELARSIEVRESLKEYRKHSHKPSDEEMYEMRSAFGRGHKIVNVLTGEVYRT